VGNYVCSIVNLRLDAGHVVAIFGAKSGGGFGWVSGFTGEEIP